MTRNDDSKMRGAGLAAAVLVLASLLAACVAAPRTLEAPEVDLVGLALLDGSADAQRFRIGLRVTNPNDVRVSVQRLSFNVRLAGGGVMSGQAPGLLALEPGEVREIEVDVRTSLVSSVSRLLSLVQGPAATVPYDLDGLVTLSRGIQPTRPFTARGEVPLAIPGGFE